MITKKSREGFFIDLPKSAVLLVVVCGLKVVFLRDVPAARLIHFGGGIALVAWLSVEVFRIAKAVRRMDFVVWREVLRKDLEPASFVDFVWQALLPLSIYSLMAGIGLELYGASNSLSNSLTIAAYLTAMAFIHRLVLWITFHVLNKWIKRLGGESVLSPGYMPLPALDRSRPVLANQAMTECDQELPARSFELNYFVLGFTVIAFLTLFVPPVVLVVSYLINALLEGRWILPLELGFAALVILGELWVSVVIYLGTYSTVKARFTEEGICIPARSGYVMVRWADVCAVYRHGGTHGAGFSIETQDDKVITIDLSLYRHPEEVEGFVMGILGYLKRTGTGSIKHW